LPAVRTSPLGDCGMSASIGDNRSGGLATEPAPVPDTAGAYAVGHAAVPRLVALLSVPARRRYYNFMTKSIVLVGLMAASLCAQVPVAESRARITGGGGPGGKCTAEVEVDDTVEIQIFGDMARMQTLGGQPATWRRFECTSVLPGSPSGFRFRGRDGRGRQTLVRNPEEGLGVAVIRIEDTARGSEGYTFDIEWGGGSGTAAATSSNGGFNQTGNNSATATNGGFGNNTTAASAVPAGIADFAYAVHSCQEAVINRAVQNGYNSVVLWTANLQDNAGNNDVVSGSATATPARGGNQVRVQYQCTVNASTGRVVDLQVR
jgi:hypothetical protein